MVKYLFIVVCLLANLAQAKEATAEVCSEPQVTYRWVPTTWPSQEFVEKQMPEIQGRCEKITAVIEKGFVTASLPKNVNAEAVRCAYELAGLMELRSEVEQHPAYAGIERAIFESCSSSISSNVSAQLTNMWASLEESDLPHKSLD